MGDKSIGRSRGPANAFIPGRQCLFPEQGDDEKDAGQ